MTGNVGSGTGPLITQDPYPGTETAGVKTPSSTSTQIGALTPPSYKDELSQALGSRLEYLSYTQDIAEPKLPTPKGNASSLIDQDLLNAAKEFGVDLNKEFKLPQSDTADLLSQVNTLFSSEEFQEAVANLNPDAAEVKMRATLFTEQSNDPKFASLAKKGESISFDKGSETWKKEAQQVQKELGQISGSLFAKYVKEQVPQEEQKALEFAYNTRAEGSIEEKLTPEQLEMYKKVLADADSEFVKTYGLPPPPPSQSQAKLFLSKLEVDYDHAVVDGLRTAFLDGKITNEQLAGLKAFHFLGAEGMEKEIISLYKNLTASLKEDFFIANGLPKNVELNPKSFTFQAEVSFSLREAFDAFLQSSQFSPKQLEDLAAARENYAEAPKEGQALFNEVMARITPQIKADLNLPENWKPLIAEYSAALLNNINALDVSPGVKGQVIQALQHPPLGEIDPNVEELLSSAIAQTIEQMRESEGVSKLWMPVSVDVPTFSPQATAIVKNTIQILQEYQLSTTAAMEELPKEDIKVAVYMNYLKAISEALDELQGTLYEVQMASTRRSRQLSIAQQDMMANSIANQERIAKTQKKMEKSQKKQGKKSKDMDLAVKIVGPIAMAAMIAAIVLTGGLAAPFLIPCLLVCGFMLANSISTSAGGPDLMESMMKGVAELVGMLGGGEDAQLAAQGVVIAVIIAAFITCAICTGNPMLLMVGMNFGMEMMMSDNFLVNSCKECGASDKEAMIASLCILAIFMLASMAGGGLIAKGGLSTIEATQTMTKAQVMGAQAQKMSAIMGGATTMTESSVQVQEGLSENRVYTIRAELEKILGKQKARQENIEAMLSILQQIMQTLIDSLGGTAEQIANISQLQEKKYRDASSKWVINQGA